MVQAPTAPARWPASRNPARLQARPSRHPRASPNRRDPRRFGRAMAWTMDAPAAEVLGTSNSLRLFAHSFGAAFLFVSVLIA